MNKREGETIMSVYNINGNCIANIEEKVYAFMAYNVGNFDNSGGHDRYDGDDLDGIIAKWVKFFGECSADVCFLSESSAYVDKNQTAQPKARIYDIVYKYASVYNTSISWGEALLSNLRQNNIISGLFTTRESSESKYHGALININGVDVMVISVHFNHGEGTQYDTARNAQVNEIIQMTSNYDNVVIGGDFNTDNSNTLALFKNNGFILANHDVFGSFETHVRGGGIDNIAVRGNKLKMKSVRVEQGPNTDDHLPLFADIIIG